MKEFDTLYAIDKKNKIKQWKIYVKNMETYSLMEYEYGYIDGKKVLCSQQIHSGKNIGKKK